MSVKNVKKFPFLLILLLFSCGKNSSQKDCQYKTVSFYNDDINLTDIKYVKLKSDGNYIYYNLGAKGVIVYRASSTEFRVFERASPLDADNDKAKIFVDNTGPFMKDTVHKQIWDMNGVPYSGNSTCIVKQYNSTVSGNNLVISN